MFENEIVPQLVVKGAPKYSTATTERATLVALALYRFLAFPY
jgi:hypothetical protein